MENATLLESMNRQNENREVLFLKIPSVPSSLKGLSDTDLRIQSDITGDRCFTEGDAC